MEHFREEVWADFVRGTDTANEHTAMAEHMHGCSDCAAELSSWQNVKTMADREAMYSPPENSVRMAKLEFAAQQEFEAATAKLTFDTIAQPLLAGVRSMTATPRQMVYEADGLTVDLRFDQQPGSNKIQLIGQVLDRGVPRASLAGAPVTLWTGKGLPVAETSTNGFGEFHVEFQEQERLRLSIHVIGRQIVRILLADLTDKQDEGSSYASNH